MKQRVPTPWPVVVALGLACQVAQVLLLREFLMVFHGNELSIGLILAAWMLWVGLGSRWGCLLVERIQRPAACLLPVALGVLLLLPGTILLIRLLRGMFDVLPGAYLSLADMTYSCVILMAPLCLLLGFQFVLLARIWREHDRITDTHASGKAYIVEAAGNVAGGVLFTFLLVHHANAFQGALLVGLFMLVAVRMRSSANRSMVWRIGIVGLPGVLIALLVWPLLDRLDERAYEMQWRHLSPDHELVDARLSRYGNIAVAQREDQYSFFQSGHLVFSAAGRDSDAYALEELEGAVLAHFAMSQHASPKRVLLIGGGLRGMLREIARHPVERIDYVELDEVLMDAARTQVSDETVALLDSPLVRVMHMDGRLYVKSTDAAYDVVIVDLPDPSTAVLNRFYTREFFSEVSERLQPDGVFVTSIMSTADLRGSAAANRNATIYHTLSSVFPEVLPVGERTLYLFASHATDQLTFDPAVLRERYLERDVQAAGFSPLQFDLLLEEGPLRRINWVLRHHGRDPGARFEAPDPAPLFPPSLDEQIEAEARLPPVYAPHFINSDFRPIGYYYTLIFWNVLARADHLAAFEWLGRVRGWWILPIVAAAMLFGVVTRWYAQRRESRLDARYGVHVAVFSTGLSTMALQIALLFAFQSIYGFVYEMIGLIVAIFMSGLLCGTLFTQRCIRDKANLRLLAWVQLAVAGFAAGIASVLPASAALATPTLIFAVFSGTTFIAGLLNGVDFPLATACSFAVNRGADRATGTVYGIELLGACLGAALASAVLAPILGLVACCWLAAIANATAFVILMLARKPKGSTNE